jgi:hypothetical protein
MARTVRTRNGVLALSFRQDETMPRLVDSALARIGSAATDRKAA